MTQNIFVVGMDDFNYAELKALEEKDGIKFHGLLDYHRLRYEVQQVDRLIQEAQEQLDQFPDSVDAIIGFWDFPISLMVAYLCEQRGLTGASLRGAVTCEHKYWSRRKQREVIPDYVPDFCAVDPFADDPLGQVTLDFPFWLKPIKAMASHLGFRIDNQRDFDTAIEAIRADIDTLGDPFNFFLEKVDLPEAIAGVHGNYCIAENIIGGEQCTVSGYVFDGEAHIFGVVDSINYPDTTSFLSYEYPSRLPESIQAEIRSAAKTIMTHIDYGDSPFNIEFFHDDGKLWLVEINTRISQSHSALYEKVDGLPNFKILLDIGLGHAPKFPEGKGDFNYAGKFFLRTFDYEDAYVRAVPDESVIERVKAEMPQARVHIVPEEGEKLSDMLDQDSYSYELAHIYVGADTTEALRERYQRCQDILEFEYTLEAIED